MCLRNLKLPWSLPTITVAGTALTILHRPSVPQTHRSHSTVTFSGRLQPLPIRAVYRQRSTRHNVAVCSCPHQVSWKSVECVRVACDTNSDRCEGPGLRNQQQFVLSVGRRLPNYAPRRPRIFQIIVVLQIRVY